MAIKIDQAEEQRKASHLKLVLTAMRPRYVVKARSHTPRRAINTVMLIRI